MTIRINPNQVSLWTRITGYFFSATLKYLKMIRGSMYEQDIVFYGDSTVTLLWVRIKISSSSLLFRYLCCFLVFTQHIKNNVVKQFSMHRIKLEE